MTKLLSECVERKGVSIQRRVNIGVYKGRGYIKTGVCGGDM